MRVFTLVIPCVMLAVASDAQVRDTLPVPDIPGYKTLKADFHLHTVFSDGEVWPTTRVAEAWRDGLDVIALTDHTDYQPHKGDVSPDLTRPHELAKSLAEAAGMILVPGVETAEGDTHCNLLFVTAPNALRGTNLLDTLRRAREQNAFVFWNHPGWKQTAAWFPVIAAAHGERLLHGVELVNGTQFYAEAFPWIEEKDLAMLATSDAHAPVRTDYAPRTRPVTFVFAAAATLEGVREALQARRTAAWQGDRVWGSEEYLEPLWRASVTVENPSLSSRPGTPAGLRLRNESAIPFHLQARRSPPWLRVGNADLLPQTTSALQFGISREAPAGTAKFELELEVANLHTAPGRNLTIRVPVELTISR